MSKKARMINPVVLKPEYLGFRDAASNLEHIGYVVPNGFGKGLYKSCWIA
jgi:hypothetical protein